MTPTILNKLIAARTMFYLAKDHSSSSGGVRLTIACNVLQDSVELFLLALAEHVHAKIEAKTPFESYFDRINEQIHPDHLPYQTPLIALNKLRVNSKHYGMEPAKVELDAKAVAVTAFFDEVSQSRFGQAFATISLVSLLRNGEAKDFMTEAEAAYENENYAECLILCRKSLFVTFEMDYDAKPFTADTPPRGLLGLARRGLHVPYWARDKEWLKGHVEDATDYIVIDRAEIERELLKNGIDAVSFWNVRNMTPPVYRGNGKGSPWVVRQEFAIFDRDDQLAERTEYVLTTTTDILLSHSERFRRARSVERRNYSVNLRGEEVAVYRRASRASALVYTTPPGLHELTTDFAVEGLDSEGLYYHVRHLGEEVYITGFVHESDIDHQ